LATKKAGEPYGLDPAFERAMVTLACSRSKFYGRTAYIVDPACLGNETCKLALETAHAVNADLKRGPESLMIVIQRLHRLRNEGKVTHEQVVEVDEMFDAAEAAGLPSEESVEAELLPILKRRIDKETAQTVLDSYGKKVDFSERVTELLAERNRLGINDRNIGTVLGASSFEAIAQLKKLVRLPVGVAELDAFIDGGTPRGSILVWIAGTGGGKSQAMSHSSAHSVSRGGIVAYATLELPEAVVSARVTANLVGLPINVILNGGFDKAQERLAMLDNVGRFVVKEFTPHATTLEDLKQWVKGVEDDFGVAIDKLVVDYADKLTIDSMKEKSDYKLMGHVYEGLRIFAVEKKMVVETGCQSRGREERKAKKIDLEHTADSMNKVRSADLVVTLNYNEENNEMGFFVAKHRTGASRRMIGPLPVDFSCGQIAPVNRVFREPKFQTESDNRRTDMETEGVANDARHRLENSGGEDGPF